MSIFTTLLPRPGGVGRGRLSLRTRLIVAFVGVVFVATLVLGAASAIVAGTALTEVVGQQLDSRAHEESILLGRSLDQQITSLRVLALNQSLIFAVSVANQRYPAGREAVMQLLAELDKEWASAPDDSILVRGHVTASAEADTLRAYRELFPENFELIIADRRGGLVAATERTSDYNQGDEEWWQVAANGGLYIGQPELDESAGLMGMIIAVPIRNSETGEVLGVARSTYSFDALVGKIASIRVGKTGGVSMLLSASELVDQSGQIQAITPAMAEAITAAAAEPYVVRQIDGRELLVSTAPFGESVELRQYRWQIIFQQETYEALEPLRSARNAQLIVALASLAGAAALAVLVAGRITAPLSRLSAAAHAFAGGELSRRVGLNGDDEIGRLAGSFDRMAAALEQRIHSEQEAQADRLRLQDEVISVQRATLRELATPLIPLGDDVLLLPLVGSVDRERADLIFQSLLHGVAARRARRVVIDLTGIPAVDADVAATLLRAAQGVRLLGAAVTLTGIRASLAQTLVELELPLDQFTIETSLESALGRERG
jgi:anti-anti-sigma regulatory factor/HAMP domain-containing protein